MVDVNEVRPHDALRGMTPAEVYRDSERRSLAPLLPSYPLEWKTRRVSRTGNASVNDDAVFVGTAIAGQIIGLQQESALDWRAHFFGVDLGTIEILPGSDAFTREPVRPPVSTVSPPVSSKRRPVNASDARPDRRKNLAVNA